LKKLEKTQGKALEKFTNEDEYQHKTQMLVNELRVWKEKNKKLEALQSRD